MRAIVTTDYGSPPEVVELDVPEPADGEVRVRVHAASVNGFDLAVAAGYLKEMMEHRFPVVLGKDFAGTVDAVGAGVNGYAPGDRVFGVVTKPYLGDGSFAEYATVATAVGLAKLPDSIDFTEAGALGLAGTAALTAVDSAGPAAGHTVLVAGATGGVGNQVVQLAVDAGAHVIATAHSDEEKTLVTELGASEVVDYTADVAGAVRAAHADGVDVVFHLAGDPSALVPALRDGGVFVSTLIMSPAQIPAEGATVVPVMAVPDPAMLARCAGNQAQGRTRVHIERVYTLGEGPTAIADFGNGTLGKLVIAID
jgi:NADPH:quinone reductase-like Zn-dependent oxidoreductase